MCDYNLCPNKYVSIFFLISGVKIRLTDIHDVFISGRKFTQNFALYSF